MKHEIKKLQEMRHEYSLINMSNYLSSEDYDRLDFLEESIEALTEELHGFKAVAAKVIDTASNNVVGYLTDDALLCYSQTPTWFESEEEAFKYFEEAWIKYKETLRLEFIEKEF